MIPSKTYPAQQFKNPAEKHGKSYSLPRTQNTPAFIFPIKLGKQSHRPHELQHKLGNKTFFPHCMDKLSKFPSNSFLPPHLDWQIKMY